jgi:hypothetical protein
MNAEDSYTTEKRVEITHDPHSNLYTVATWGQPDFTAQLINIGGRAAAFRDTTLELGGGNTEIAVNVKVGSDSRSGNGKIICVGFKAIAGL